MSDPSSTQHLSELESLRQEVSQLRTIKLAFEAQDELVRSLVAVGQAASGHLMLRAIVLQAAHLASKLTQAEECSLFLLKDNGSISDSILARGATIREHKQNIIGKVLEDGLAGWVASHRTTALIADTIDDDRWILLPDQPYTARSVLCLPIMRGKVVLGVLTLTHSQPNQFSTEMARIMEMCVTQMALALDNARLHIQEPQQDTPVSKPQEPVVVVEPLSKLGLYIIDNRGKLLYASHRFAEIFGYRFSQLVSLGSVLALVHPNHRHLFTDKLNQCFTHRNPYFNCEFKGKRANGKSILLEIDGARTKFYGKYAIIGALRCRKGAYDSSP